MGGFVSGPPSSALMFLRELTSELKEIGARRKCSFDGEGKGSCTTGNVEGGFEVDDQTIGEVNVGEFNLDAWGGNDCESLVSSLWSPNE